ncbi:Uma2 family endonuclease [candidate division KSB1 bacterium]|nr:Uma2 family endonuclease [candidate division KSB1 bacterium]
MSAQAQLRLTPEEYLAIERKAEFKSEYYQGEMFALAGANEPHAVIASNINCGLGNQLAHRDCLVYNGDLRVKVNPLGKYTYPDVMVACGKRIFDDDQHDTLVNPVLIVEILSSSTEAYARGAKFDHYQYIKTLAEYILVAQDSRRVEQFVRQNDGAWTYRAFKSSENVMKLESIGCELRLAEIYLKVPGLPPTE